MAVISYGQPHGFETVRSAFPTQCPFSGPLSVRSLCCSCSLLNRLWFPPQSIFLLLLLLRSVTLCAFLSVFLSLFPLSVRLGLFSYSQMSHSSLCSSSSETQDPKPDGSSHKFQAACHTFCLGKRKLMHAWPTQQPLLRASGHAAARGEKSSCFRRAEH